MEYVVALKIWLHPDLIKYMLQGGEPPTESGELISAEHVDGWLQYDLSENPVGDDGEKKILN